MADTDALAGKVAFVAGGSSGINLGVAHGFAEAGARVALISRSAEKIERAAGELRAAGHEAIGLAADVGRQKGITLHAVGIRRTP